MKELKVRTINKNKLVNYFYLFPAILILAFFVFMPFFQTIYRSFFLTDKMGKNALFIGLENYIKLFSSADFYNSIWVSFKFVLLVVVVGVALGFITAIISQKTFPGLKAFAAAYAMPIAISSSGIAIVFKVMLNQSIGILNKILGTDINWLADPKFALLALGILTGWLNSGMNFLFFSAGLAGIDDSLYESAEIDGAKSLNKLRYITLPSLKPITFFIIVTNIINSFQSFAQVKLLTSGGPGVSTNVIVYDIYKNAFMNYKYGYASAESVVLFVIIMVLTLLLFKTRGGLNDGENTYTGI